MKPKLNYNDEHSTSNQSVNKPDTVAHDSTLSFGSLCETNIGKQTRMVQEFLSDQLDSVEKRNILRNLLPLEPKQLANDIINSPGKRFIIAGYGSFGGSTLAVEICEDLKLQLRERSPRSTVNTTIIYLLSNKKAAPSYEASIMQSGGKKAFVARLTTNLQSSASSAYSLDEFLLVLNDILLGTKTGGELRSLVEEHLSKQDPLSRIVLIIDELHDQNVFDLFEKNALFEHDEVTSLFIIKTEAYIRWPEKERQWLEKQDQYHIIQLRCLWESEYNIINRILGTATFLNKSNTTELLNHQDFKNYLAFLGRGQLDTIWREIIRSVHWIHSPGSDKGFALNALDNELIRHHAKLQNILDNNWLQILQENFKGYQRMDRAKQAVYSLLDWIIDVGTFSTEELAVEADKQPVSISTPRLRQIVIDNLLNILILNDYLTRDGNIFMPFRKHSSSNNVQTEQNAYQSQINTAFISAEKYRPHARTTVFISYSHADAAWLSRLRTHLKPIVRDGIIECWDDTRIKPGSDWREEIKIAIKSAKVAILLISADFLASDFIANDELPPLLTAAKQEGVRILPLIIGHCHASLQLSGLAKFQSLNSPENVLSGMDRNDSEKLFAQLVAIIAKIDEPNH